MVESRTPPFLTLALDDVSGLLYIPPPPQGTHCMGGWVGPKAGLDIVEKRKTLPLPGLKSQLSSQYPNAILTALFRLFCVSYSSVDPMPINQSSLCFEMSRKCCGHSSSPRKDGSPLHPPQAVNASLYFLQLYSLSVYSNVVVITRQPSTGTSSFVLLTQAVVNCNCRRIGGTLKCCCHHHPWKLFL
jgi:hypothetical protein